MNMLLLAGAATAASLVTVGDPGPANPSEASISQIRAATAKYQDVKAALADGYIRDPAGMCETATMLGKPASLGAMGIHYFRPDLLGISGPPNPRVNGTSTYTDFHKPAVLIYEPESDGSLKLVAVENLVFEKAWRAAGHTQPPSFHGIAYNHMVDNPATKIDEAHGFMPHYDRHVWAWRDNPNGMFAQYNPNVSCAAAEKTPTVAAKK
jgi:hypothetical protein